MTCDYTSQEFIQWFFEGFEILKRFLPHLFSPPRTGISKIGIIIYIHRKYLSKIPLDELLAKKTLPNKNCPD